MKKKKELKYNAWNDHLNNTRERTNYSIRRMDLLIISICGASIYIIFETLRVFKTEDVDIEYPSLLLISGLFFLIAITSNFISQKTGYYSNNNEEKYINIQLKKIKGKEFCKTEEHQINDKVNSYNWWTNTLNIASIFLMVLGLILLVVFYFNLF